MFFHLFRAAWRTLKQNRGFTTINIVGLATGICTCIVIYTLAAYEFSFDTFHPDGNRIYRIGTRIAEHDSYQYGEDVAPPTADALHREIPGIEAAAFILLLAIINFINLSTAQSLRRAKETQIRRILGSSRGTLMFRFLTETALVTTLAAILSLLLAYPLVSTLHTWLPPDLRYHPFDLSAVLFILGIIAGTTLLAGIYPARVLSASKLNRRYTVRKTLIVFQFTISLIFIIGSIVYGKQLHYMLNADPGFTSKAVITITDFNRSPREMQLFANKAAQLPGIEDITKQGHAPAGEATIEIPLRLENRRDKEDLVALQAADKNFLPFYRIPLLAGVIADFHTVPFTTRSIHCSSAPFPISGKA